MTDPAHLVYLALGTNVGQRPANLRKALASLSPQIQVCRVSGVYETEPWGYTDQPAFLNQVIEARTDLSPVELLARLKDIEVHLGRQPTFRNGPRLIDLDVLLYDDLVMQNEQLILPHPGMSSRAFVLVPLAEIAPDLLHPSAGQTVRELLTGVEASGVKRVMHKVPSFGLRTYVMGVLNITPDSFSGDGILQSASPVEAATEQAQRFIEAGVDILDVGGESTRPGAQIVAEEEEQARVVPVVEALARLVKPLQQQVLISVDTYKAGVAEAALHSGADWINDIWGLRADLGMGAVIAAAGAPVVIMHNRLKPATAELQERLGGRYVGVQYDNLLGDIKNELMESVQIARQAGIPEEHIILDPGVGFGKTVEQNLELVNRLNEVCDLGYPLLLGPSRKSFIGYTLNLPPDQRLEGTAAAVTVGITRGADIVRVHDVEFMLRLARMTDAIVRR